MKNSVTIVTGEPRSGTSLMMQTLKLLGVNVLGKEYPRVINNDIRKTERAKKLNPKGFYEIPGIVINGIKKENINNFIGKTVKIIVTGLPKTDISTVGKIILCLRDPREIAVSQKNLTSGLSVANGDKWVYANEVRKTLPNLYTNRMGRFLIWLSNNRNICSKILPVDYFDMINKSKSKIDTIIKFLNLSCSKKQKIDALDNISSALYRSNVNNIDDYWKGNTSELADKIYNTLLFLNSSEVCITSVCDEVKSFLLEQVKESQVWIDDTEFKTWLRMRPSLYRSMVVNNRGICDKLQKTTKSRRRQNPSQCKYYGRCVEKYTIKRVSDIGDLVRNKVLCTKDNKQRSVETCYSCWNIGINKELPQRGIVQ